jgi:hypothetical protein
MDIRLAIVMAVNSDDRAREVSRPWEAVLFFRIRSSEVEARRRPKVIWIGTMAAQPGWRSATDWTRSIKSQAVARTCG